MNSNPGTNPKIAEQIAKAIHAPHVNRRVSRFVQIVSSEPHAQSRRNLLERKADQILRQARFYKRMDAEEKAIRQEASNYKLRAFYNPKR